MSKVTKYGHSYPKTCVCGCTERFIGRRNQKFLNDAHRYRYNNNKAAEKNTITKKLVNLIKRNYLILQKYHPQSLGKNWLYLPNLIIDGFSPLTYTGIEKETENGRDWFCLDNFLFYIENNNILITKKS
jgi:hypothetical protein